MQRDPRTYLWDALEAARRILAFVDGKSWDDYASDLMLSSAVERQFEIVGEALSHLSRSSPDTTARIPDVARIIAFRNVLIHRYASVDSALVWSFAQERLDVLIEVLETLLQEINASSQ
jgi:uncharacterized protein with HEPN domain